MYHLFSGFRGTLRPPALPIHGLEDNVPDVHDEADFDIPYTQAVLERFMTHMSKLADVEYQVQGPGELRCKDRVSYCCHITSIYLLYALHIPCIYHIYIKLNRIYIVYAKYIPSICSLAGAEAGADRAEQRRSNEGAAPPENELGEDGVWSSALIVHSLDD